MTGSEPVTSAKVRTGREWCCPVVVPSVVGRDQRVQPSEAKVYQFWYPK